MIAVDERSERILKAYRSASREFVDGHTEAFIQDLPSIFHMGDLVGYMELIELPPSVVHQWAESHDAGASIRSGYDYYASKFDDVMFYPQDGEESRFARHYMRNFGFDFAAEAREVLGFVKKIPYLQDDEVLRQLQASKGLYAAEAVRWRNETPLFLRRAAIHMSFVDSIWISCFNTFYKMDIEMRNGAGIDFSGYDGPPGR